MLQLKDNYNILYASNILSFDLLLIDLKLDVGVVIWVHVLNGPLLKHTKLGNID